MSKPVLFSQHSSNPLEVPSSDPLNAKYVRSFRRAQKMRELYQSSEDPLSGYNVDEQTLDYQSHVKQLFPDIAPLLDGKKVQPQRRTHEELVYSGSEDELEIVGGDEDEMMTLLDDPDLTIHFNGIDEKENHEEEQEEQQEEDDMAEDDNDAESEDTDEELTINLKSPEEREEIEEEIEDLLDTVPELNEDYRIVDRLGTGTFSSVYKAVDLHYAEKWHNDAWMGRHPPGSSAHYQSLLRPIRGKVFLAIKRIYVTSNPERIRNEIAILEDCRGCRHVSQLITAFRNRDQVVAIMPYHRNDDFRDFYRTLPMEGIKAYFRCLLRALRDIHARGIIHRDVKPANFLFDARTQLGTLCDFGLACRVDFNAPHGHCLHTPPSRTHLHGQKKSNKVIDVELVKSMQREARVKSGLPADRVGYPEKDLRPHSKANRAGTRGFRAPEVLLKCNEQTGAIDIWSAGIVMLSFLTGKFPLFQSNDDVEALMEIASIIGRRRMEAAATLHNRTFATNVPVVSRDGLTWREFVERNNPELFAVPTPPSSPQPSSSRSGTNNLNSQLSSEPAQHTRAESQTSAFDTYLNDLDLAFDLLDKLLVPESINRITARDALYHPFLVEPGEGDDAFFPHPIGEGLCGQYHFRDEVTEEHYVQIVGLNGIERRGLHAGQGVPIGDQPCEYHQDLDDLREQEGNRSEGSGEGSSGGAQRASF